MSPQLILFFFLFPGLEPFQATVITFFIVLNLLVQS